MSRWGMVWVVLWGAALVPGRARACGGFFCGQKPVDQQAERILFAVGETHTDMIVQISYRGAAPDFAWVLPLGFVPTEEDMGTFPALALTQLDANTAPIFVRPPDPECNSVLLNGGGSDADTPGVTVHIEDIVGPYEVVVIEGSDPAELVTWLRDHRYQVSDAMIPFVEPYVSEGMKLLALRLTPNQGVEDIEPFRIRMPTTTPSIPLRLTAVAAEPEMGVLVTILADGRYGPSNWSELEIDPATIRYQEHAWPAETNYLARVAREADAFDGMAFVTELAGPTAPLLEAVEAATPGDDEQRRARDELAALLRAHPYLTRLYARLSPGEMRIDPLFGPHAGGDVPREVQLARIVDGVDMCLEGRLGPCDHALCGDGACVEVATDSWPSAIAACDCADGQVARASFDPLGEPTVSCVDPSRSLLNPGDRNGPDAPPLGDPCDAYDCGLGSCRAVDMTPACRCDDGAVAVGLRGPEGRITRCVAPDATVEIPELPPDPPPMDGGVEPSADAGTPRTGGGGCAAAPVSSPAAPWWIAGLLVGLGRLRRAGRRRAR